MITIKIKVKIGLTHMTGEGQAIGEIHHPIQDLAIDQTQEAPTIVEIGQTLGDPIIIEAPQIIVETLAAIQISLEAEITHIKEGQTMKITQEANITIFEKDTTQKITLNFQTERKTIATKMVKSTSSNLINSVRSIID